jgi:NADH-quinone oxidoreductase subunit E
MLTTNSDIDAAIDQYDSGSRALIPILLEVQAEHHYLPEDELRKVAAKMKVPLIQVFQVASFYKAFSLEPRGKHLVTVCMGTACHVRGAHQVMDRLETILDVKAGHTTADGEYTLEGVNCVGACALGPIVIIDGEYSGQVSAQKTDRLIKRLERQKG